ncbi:uncharacterized protein LOC144440841 [Glandiceps talaboti]
MSTPGWKTALLEKKYRRDEEQRKRQEEDEWKLDAMPSWKRDLVLKKRAGVQLNSWRVTPRPATVSKNSDQGKRTDFSAQPLTNKSSGAQNNSRDKVKSEAPTQNYEHSIDETDSQSVDDEVFGGGVSEEHVTSVQDNPFLKLERKRLNSGNGEKPVLNRKPPNNEVIELNRNTTSTTNYNANTSQHIPANTSTRGLQNSSRLTTVDANENKPREPEVIIIPKPKNMLIESRERHELDTKQIKLRTRSLSPSPSNRRITVAKEQNLSDSANSSPRTPTSPSSLSPRSGDDDSEDSVEKGKVNRLMGMFGKPVSQSERNDFRRGRLNSLDRNTYQKPSSQSHSSKVTTGGKPPLPPSTVKSKPPITPMTTVTTHYGYSAHSRPPPSQPVPQVSKVDLKPVETVPSRITTEEEENIPMPKPRKPKKQKLDASTIIRLENSEPVKRPNYATRISPSVDDEADSRDKESLNSVNENDYSDQVVRRRHPPKIQPLDVKGDDDEELPKPNTVSNIRHSFSEYNGPVPVPTPAPIPVNNTKRRAPPPPSQPTSTEKRAPQPPIQPTSSDIKPQKDNSANVTVISNKITTQKPAQIKTNEAIPGTNTSRSKEPISQPILTETQTSVNKQTIVMTPVTKESNVNADSDIRQAVEELKSVGTTFRVTPRKDKNSAKNETKKDNTKNVYDAKKPTVNEMNDNSITYTKKTTLTVKSVSRTTPIFTSEDNTKVQENHTESRDEEDIPVSNIDDIPVSNIDDLLTPPTSPTKESLPELKQETIVVQKENKVIVSNKTETPKPVQNGEIVRNGTNVTEQKNVEPVNEFVKVPLKRISVGKHKKISMYRFIGENAPTGKPSMLTKSRQNMKRGIHFNDSATVKHFYPSEESMLEDDEDTIQPAPESDSDEDSSSTTKSGLKSNTALSAQGLQSYTPTHLQEMYMNTIERRRQEEDQKPEPVQPPPPPPQPEDLTVKPLDDQDADYFSTSSSSTALLF